MGISGSVVALGFVFLGGLVGFGGFVFAVVVAKVVSVSAWQSSQAKGGEKPDPLLHVTMVTALLAQYPALHWTK